MYIHIPFIILKSILKLCPQETPYKSTAYAHGHTLYAFGTLSTTIECLMYVPLGTSRCMPRDMLYIHTPPRLGGVQALKSSIQSGLSAWIVTQQSKRYIALDKLLKV